MILTYHEIAPHDCDYLYSVSRERFAEHLRFCSQWRQERPAEAPEVTFDDGHASNYRYGLPLLEEHGWRAIFFVLAGKPGEDPAFVSWPELREMVSLGHQIQSHGWSHKFLTQCSNAELRHELADSKARLEDHLGIAVDAISLPGGRGDNRVLEHCARAGYQRVYSSQPWRTPTRRKGVEVLGRMMVQRTADAETLRHLFTLRGRVLYLLRAREGMKQAVRGVLGDRIYHSLWCRLFAERERHALNDEYLGSRPS